MLAQLRRTPPQESPLPFRGDRNPLCTSLANVTGIMPMYTSKYAYDSTSSTSDDAGRPLYKRRRKSAAPEGDATLVVFRETGRLVIVSDVVATTLGGVVALAGVLELRATGESASCWPVGERGADG